MLAPYLDHTHFIYVNVQGIIWITNGLSLCDNLEAKAADYINDIYANISPEKTIILDFDNVSGLADHCLLNLFNSIQNQSREIILINCLLVEDLIQTQLKSIYKKELKRNHDEGDNLYLILNGKDSSIQTTLQIEIEKLTNTVLQDFVRNSFEKFEDGERFLYSTPIKSTGSYNASKLLHDRNAFFWISLNLAKKVKGIINNDKIGSNNKPLKLLTVSLRSSPFAASAALLNGLPIETIDHLGPRHKVYDLDMIENLNNNKSHTYIYVGDFCVGGTEVKIAKTYANIASSQLEHAIVIGSLFDKKIFEFDFNLHSLVSLHNLHPEAIFKI